MHLLIFAPRMAPLSHIHTYINNTASQGWSHRGIVSTSSSVGPILWELSLVNRRQHIHTSVGRVPGEDNKMVDAALQITHLPDRKFLSHLRKNFPQSKPWRLLPLLSASRQNLTTMLHNKQSITKGFSTNVFKKDTKAWRQWRYFCSWLQIAPNLK